jgi:DNA-binding beta-propeller fold protein YncE
MKTVSCACLVAAALVVGYLPLTAAGAARLAYLASVYADDQQVGLHLPEGVACGAGGLVVVGDTENDRLVSFTYRDRTLGPVSAIKVPQLTAPSRVQLSSKGDIYALDSRQRRIVRLDSSGQFKAVLAVDGAPAPSTIVPKSFALDAADNVYVLDEFSARVLVVDTQGKFQRALAFPGDIGFATDLAVDFEGNILLVDSVKRRIFTASKDAVAFTPLGGDLSASVATMPTSIMASKGLLFVAEGSGSTIDAFGRDGKFLSRMLTMGWTEGMLNHPSQLCVNGKDEVFVADRDNSRVQVFQLTR